MGGRCEKFLREIGFFEEVRASVGGWGCLRLRRYMPEVASRSAKSGL